jgi:hypothetical protein
MAMTPEAAVKKKIRAVLDHYGVYYAMPIGTGYGNSGVPDFLCCVKGRFFAIEAKAGKGRTTALQDQHLERIQRNQGVALVINEENLHLLTRTLDSLHDIEDFK